MLDKVRKLFEKVIKRKSTLSQDDQQRIIAVSPKKLADIIEVIAPNLAPEIIADNQLNVLVNYWKNVKDEIFAIKQNNTDPISNICIYIDNGIQFLMRMTIRVCTTDELGNVEELKKAEKEVLDLLGEQEMNFPFGM